ncbi:MAG: cytochrome-c peroxidase [Caldimonas sp.]
MERTKAARARAVGLALCAALVAGCGGGSGSGDSAADGGDVDFAAPEAPMVSAEAAVGEKIFFDPALSASGRHSCASCHVPAVGHSPANALAVQLGGANSDLQGTRKVPAIRYLATSPAFVVAADGTPTGGLFWDGRAGDFASQAGEPFLNPSEMANADKAAVVAKLARAPYAAEFRRAFGDDAFADVDAAFAQMTLALQRYQTEDAQFQSFSSKYDAFLRGNAALSAQEERGLALFEDPRKGNCAACHPSAPGPDGAPPLFTDFGYGALGVPRNPEIARNADPASFDLGLCQRSDLAARSDLCGAFKVPSLRNAALRKAFFHNGRFKTLKETLTFYVQRDTHPEKWYPVAAEGTPARYDDLPPEHRGNVLQRIAPYDRRRGDAPALSDAEIDDVIAFLATLSDGFVP